MVDIGKYSRLDNESDDELIYRICSQKDEIGTWQDVADVINCLNNTSFGESTFRKKYQSFQKILDANQSVFVSNDAYLKEIRLQKRELERERKKLQTEKIEYNKYLREDARDEMIIEQICDSIKSLEPLEAPHYIESKKNNKSYLLTIADAHFGVEYKLNDLFGEVINGYSPEIFYDRMTELFCSVVKIIQKENIDELNIWELGDGIDSIIRLTSQLMKLRYGVIDSTVKYAEYLATWLNELSMYTKIKFQMCLDSNHNQLRLCSAPKNSFPEENMSKVMLTIIKERLKNNPNIEIIENPTGYCFMQFSKFQILGIHGETKSKNPINDLSRVYNVQFSYLIGGHVHCAKSEEVGIGCEEISVRSLIGIDSYGLSLNKTSNAGASLFHFDEKKGLIREDKIILD